MTLLNKWEAQGNFLFRYRGSLPVLIILPALYVMYRKPEESLPFGLSSGPVLCYLTSLTGLLIRCYTVGYSARNTSGRNTAEGQIADVVNTTGIYSICRHPLYIGNFLMWLGIALLTAHVWFILLFITLYILYYERIMFAEERFLEKKFGTAYTQWADHTPAIIPHFQRWQPNRNPFSLTKVWSREKTGLLLLNLLFWLFSHLHATDVSSLIFEQSHWSLLLGIALLNYLITKGLEKTTGVFSSV